MLKKLSTLLLASIAFAAAPAMAEQGKIQVKLVGTAVLPNGEITEIEENNIGAPSDIQTIINDNYVPTIAIEYFVTDKISVETIAGLTTHRVEGRGALDGLGVIDGAHVLPTTLTIKYHFGSLDGFKPYVGAGPSYFFFIDEFASPDLEALGINRANLTNSLGLALQAGFDLPISEKVGFAVDAKRYFVGTDARFFDGDNLLLRTRHAVDPWVLSAGLSLRF